MAKSSARPGGRAARVAIRSSGKRSADPAPPGPKGGRYAPLSESEMRLILDAALRLLDELGMGECPDSLARRFVESGAVRTDSGRICYPRSMVEDFIASAAKSIILHGRDPDRSIEVGGSAVYFGTGGAAVQTLDLETGQYRPSTLRDLYDFTRLQDRLKNVAWFTRCCVATDVPDVLDLDVNTAYALIRGTTKPIATSFFAWEHVAPVVEMFDMAEGGEGRFSKRPWCTAHVSAIISPFRFGKDAVDVAAECVRRNVPLSCITAAQSGATAPATPAAFLAASLAETIAALMMVNVFKRGYPMVFSNWPFVIDLRTGAFSGGGGETALLNAASAQLSNWLGLPSGVASSMSDAKAVDAQMGMEKGISAAAAALAGGNMIYESSGMTSALLGASFEAFVLDDEMISSVYRIVRGIEVTADALDFDSICRSVLESGHFLGSDDTLRSMERDYVYPELADREAPSAWSERGALDVRERARARAREILVSHKPEYLNADADGEIRRKFNILLD